MFVLSLHKSLYDVCILYVYARMYTFTGTMIPHHPKAGDSNRNRSPHIKDSPLKYMASNGVLDKCREEGLYTSERAVDTFSLIVCSEGHLVKFCSRYLGRSPAGCCFEALHTFGRFVRNGVATDAEQRDVKETSRTSLDIIQ